MKGMKTRLYRIPSTMNTINHEHQAIMNTINHQHCKPWTSSNHEYLQSYTSTISQNKLVSSRYNDKRYILDNGIETFARRHYKTRYNLYILYILRHYIVEYILEQKINYFLHKSKKAFTLSLLMIIKWVSGRSTASWDLGVLFCIGWHQWS